MNLNTQQLQYLLEIENTGSISQAAANLFMAQPNLSRVLKETEQELGFQIFTRTRNGVYPTELGEIFLHRAKSILYDAMFIEQLSSPALQPVVKVRLSVPHSYNLLGDICKKLDVEKHLSQSELFITEDDPDAAFNKLETGQADLAIIRYLPEYASYYLTRIRNHGFTHVSLGETGFSPVFQAADSLARMPSVKIEDLRQRLYIKIKTEEFESQYDIADNHIYVSNRLAQLQLLSTIPGSYCWSEPLSPEILEIFHLTQRPCSSMKIIFQNVLVYRSGEHQQSEFEHLIRSITIS